MERLGIELRTFFVFALLLGGFIVVIGAYALLHVDLTGEEARAKPARPNVLLLLVDGAGARFQPEAHPALSRLAGRALRATQAYTTSGRGPEAWAALMMHEPGHAAAPDGLPARLEAAGYRMRFFGSEDVSTRWGIGQGFARHTGSRPAERAGADDTDHVAEAADWLRQTARSAQPFVLIVDCAAFSESSRTPEETVERMLSALGGAQLRGSAAILITAVQGDHTRPRPERWRVPLLLAYAPRFPQPVTVSAPVSLADVGPTIAHLAGLAPISTAPNDGQSLFDMRLRDAYRTAVAVKEEGVLYVGSGSLWARERDGAIESAFGSEPVDAALLAQFHAYGTARTDPAFP